MIELKVFTADPPELEFLDVMAIELYSEHFAGMCGSMEKVRKSLKMHARQALAHDGTDAFAMRIRCISIMMYVVCSCSAGDQFQKNDSR
jgi:hypothetical protein